MKANLAVSPQSRLSDKSGKIKIKNIPVNWPFYTISTSREVLLFFPRDEDDMKRQIVDK